MLKVGIYKPEQLRDPRNFTNFIGGMKKISISLYDQVVDFPNADDIAERIMLLFKEDRGASKWTFARRFESFDAEVLEVIRDEFASRPENAHWRIHDAGVSDGRTSCDFFGKLAALHPNIDYVASDYKPEVQVIESGRTKVTVSPDGEVLEVVWPPFVFNLNNPDNPVVYPVNFLAGWIVRKVYLPGILRGLRDGKLRPRTLPLFCPAALKLAESDSRFRLLHHDLLHPSTLENPVTIFRAMNVLNPVYFAQEDMARVIGNIHEALEDGGLLVTGSNLGPDTPVNGGIYRRRDGRFETVRKTGTGSPVQELIEAHGNEGA